MQLFQAVDKVTNKIIVHVNSIGSLISPSRNTEYIYKKYQMKYFKIN